MNRVKQLRLRSSSYGKEINPTEEQMTMPMPSDADMSAWYGGYLRFTIIYGLLDGWHVTQAEDESYQYYPSGDMTRKEVAEMLFRMMLYKAERYVFKLLVVGSACMIAEFGEEKQHRRAARKSSAMNCSGVLPKVI